MTTAITDAWSAAAIHTDVPLVSAGAELPRDLDRLVLRDPADAAEQRREILAVHVLHREDAAAVRVAEVVETADVLVRHLARDAELVVKLPEPRIVRGDARREELQRDRLVEGEVVRAVHLAMPPRPSSATSR